MSKWRYEVVKKNCKPTISYRPDYVVFCKKSIRNYLETLYEGRELLERVAYWSEYASEIPTRAIYDTRLDWCLAANTYGNKNLFTFTNIEEVFPARRIGRMFPRHKQQIIYK